MLRFRAAPVRQGPATGVTAGRGPQPAWATQEVAWLPLELPHRRGSQGAAETPRPWLCCSGGGGFLRLSAAAAVAVVAAAPRAAVALRAASRSSRSKQLRPAETAAEAAIRGFRPPRRRRGRLRRRDLDPRNDSPSQEYVPKKVRRQRKLEKLRLAREGPPPVLPYVGPTEVVFDDVHWTAVVAERGDGRSRCTTKEVLTGASWGLRGAERVGLIGINGCGKSVQLLMLLGQVQPTSGSVTVRPESTRIAYMGQEADLECTGTVAEELLSVFANRSYEEIDADLERLDVDSDEQEVSRLLDERATLEEEEEEVEELCARLGLLEFCDTSVAALSGGWQMRVSLGKIMLQKPDLLLLDEPTNHVDLETVECMEHFLQSQDIPMIVVSHDRYFLNKVCTKIVQVYRGKAYTYNGSYVDYLQAQDVDLVRQWGVFQEYEDKLSQLRATIDNLARKVKTDQAAQKRLELQGLLKRPVPKPQVNEIHDFRFPVVERPPPDQAVLKVECLSVQYGAAPPVLRQVSFTVVPGEKVAIVGRNGSGKSVLLRTILGEPDAGRVSGSIERPNHASYFPQRLAEQVNEERASVREVLSRSFGDQDIEDVMRRLRLDDELQDQPLCKLSGGEKARAAFAWFLLHPCSLLVLDEPTNHLDIATRELLEDAVKAFDGTALVVSHDRFFLREFATRVIEVKDGQLLDYGSWDEYAAAAGWDLEPVEKPFILQDAKAFALWSKKRLSRLRKREGNVGLRRLSPRAGALASELPAQGRRARGRPLAGQAPEG